MRTPKTFERPTLVDERTGEVVEAYRQSLLSNFDNCGLATMWDLLKPEYSTLEQARGTLFHRFARRMLETLRSKGDHRMEVGDALDLLHDVCLQRDVPPERILVLPSREREDLRWIVVKFASENNFTIERIVDLERRLWARVPIIAADGASAMRVISGQPDVLLAAPPDGAVILDYKTGFYSPPRPGEGVRVGPRHLSWIGFFQGKVYALLVFLEYPAIQRAAFREFYPREGVARIIEFTREDVPRIMEEVTEKLTVLERLLDVGPREEVWARLASPGPHCSWCPRPGRCPIESEDRRSGAIRTKKQAEKYAAERFVADAVKEHRTEALKAWVATHGPVEFESSRGRQAVGWKKNSTGSGRTFTTFVPPSSDRHPADENIAAAFRAAAERKREARR